MFYIEAGVFIERLDRIGLDWIGLDWIGLDRIGWLFLSFVFWDRTLKPPRAGRRDEALSALHFFFLDPIFTGGVVVNTHPITCAFVHAGELCRLVPNSGAGLGVSPCVKKNRFEARGGGSCGRSGVWMVGVVVAIVPAKCKTFFLFDCLWRRWPIPGTFYCSTSVACSIE